MVFRQLSRFALAYLSVFSAKMVEKQHFQWLYPLNTIMTSSVMTSSKWRFFQKNSWCFFDNFQGLLFHICPFLAGKRLKNSFFSHFTPLNTIMTSSVMTSSKWRFFQKNRWSFFDNSPDLLWHICPYLVPKWSKNSKNWRKICDFR